jgi:peptidoglycan/xylan/chitin deacetylase (PgdA/CDA1 family)
MALKTGWLRYLRDRRGWGAPSQLVRMARLHGIPFKTLLQNIFDVMAEFGAGFTFPVVSSTALTNPDLVGYILDSPHEMASHGHRHVSYRYISPEDQEVDIERSIQVLRNMGIPIRGFRAPYNIYTEDTPGILQRQDIIWDAGLGYQPEHRDLARFFRVPVDGGEADFTCIPVSGWSDDLMIDLQGLGNPRMAEILKDSLTRTCDKKGVIMFDLHPIRMGQPKYVDVLRQMLAHGEEIGGWFPTVTEAVVHWDKHQTWKKGASFCCLLTGDIDNFTFKDYLLRFR